MPKRKIRHDEKSSLIEIAKIKIYEDVQQRVDIDPDGPRDIAEALRLRNKIPDLDVFWDGREYVLADGFTRIAGWKMFGVRVVPCNLHKGGRRDAKLFACGCNHSHGKRRTKADRDHAIETLLADPEWGKRSLNWIAEQARCDHKTVGKVAKRLAVCGTLGNVPNARETKDGRMYPSDRTPTNAPTVLVDDEGTRIPQRLVDAFTSMFYEDAPGEIRAIVKRLQPIAKWNPYLSPDVARLLKEAADLLDCSTPVSVCLPCAGAGCSSCKRSGFLARIAA